MPIPPPALEADGTANRAARILDAAERCFVRQGFHRTTMQDVAAEAGMSAGNLYRYFPSKDAVVAGLAERDRAEMSRDFDVLASADDVVAALDALGHKHFSDEPREKAILVLQIWAEATRDPAFADVAGVFERDAVGRMTQVFAQAQARGTIDPALDARDVAVLVCTLANGLFVRRAIVPDFDSGREVRNVLAVIGALLSGRCAPQPVSAPEPVP